MKKGVGKKGVYIVEAVFWYLRPQKQRPRDQLATPFPPVMKEKCALLNMYSRVVAGVWWLPLH